MSRSDLDFSTFQRRVEDAGGDLYPIGSASLIFPLLPWIVGSILAFESKPRARAWSISIGLAVTVATYVTFQSIDSDLNDLLN
jgi:Na+/proline symporter